MRTNLKHFGGVGGGLGTYYRGKELLLLRLLYIGHQEKGGRGRRKTTVGEEIQQHHLCWSVGAQPRRPKKTG